MEAISRPDTTPKKEQFTTPPSPSARGRGDVNRGGGVGEVNNNVQKRGTVSQRRTKTVRRQTKTSI